MMPPAAGNKQRVARSDDGKLTPSARIVGKSIDIRLFDVDLRRIAMHSVGMRIQQRAFGRRKQAYHFGADQLHEQIVAWVGVRRRDGTGRTKPGVERWFVAVLVQIAVQRHVNVVAQLRNLFEQRRLSEVADVVGGGVSGNEGRRWRI